MAKILIAGDSIIVTSAKRLEDIKSLEKYNRRALSLYEKDEDGKSFESFRVASTNGAGSINEYGASFGSESHDGGGYATITLPVPHGVENLVGYVADTIGGAVMKLNQIEDRFDAALTEVNDKRAEVIANIEVH